VRRNFRRAQYLMAYSRHRGLVWFKPFERNDGRVYGLRRRFNNNIIIQYVEIKVTGSLVFTHRRRRNRIGLKCLPTTRVHNIIM